jgi:hypothetical protein
MSVPTGRYELVYEIQRSPGNRSEGLTEINVCRKRVLLGTFSNQVYHTYLMFIPFALILNPKFEWHYEVINWCFNY